jgi:hypothetical protein
LEIPRRWQFEIRPALQKKIIIGIIYRLGAAGTRTNFRVSLKRRKNVPLSAGAGRGKVGRKFVIAGISVTALIRSGFLRDLRCLFRVNEFSFAAGISIKA